MFGFDNSKEIKDLKDRIDRFHNIMEKRLSHVEASQPKEAVSLISSIKSIKDNCFILQGKIENSLIEISKKEIEFNKFYDQIRPSLAKFVEDINEVDLKREKIEEFFNNIETKNNTAIEASEEINNSINEINEYLERANKFPEELQKMEQLLEDFNEQKESIEQLKNHALMRKNDIDKVHREIYGSDIKKEDGSVDHIEGTKERIENSLNGLDSKINSLSQNFNNELDSYKESYNNRISENKKEYIQLLKNTRSFIDATKDKINELLPGAMAAGLSHAYEAKKKEEVSNLKSSEEKFQNSIIGLIAISSIPVLISIYLLITTNKTIIDLIDYLPKMVTAFIPIYIPIFWIAYSSSKKVNLSKRLIEEYTHKEVLGKTFSGLSNQIEKIDNESGIQQELKLKLLFNFMQVSAENPGKLISDYNSADHPLMDAIEKSAKLTDAVEKLEKIPGFTLIAKKLADKAEKILDGHTKKVQDGIDINDDLQSREEEKSESRAL